MKRFGLAIVIPALLVGTPASANEPPVNNVRCFMVATVYARVGSEEQKKVAQTAEAYYLGRLAGPASTLQPEFAEQLKQITDANNGQLMNECVRAMATRAEEIRAMQEAFARSYKP